ncbi:MAG TPA: tetratricopeptide repeat protein [Rhizomicrobium sp.]|nr:tetratricopeptide repeat protein [Rhizomicrobium sp.]
MQYIPEAMVYMAVAYERLGKCEKAEGELKGALTRYPGYAPVWENLGELLEKLKGPGMLMSTIDAMLHTNPSNAAVLNAACRIRATKGEQLDAALADCDEALRLKPGDADALDSRALARFRKGNFADAITDANSALAANPKLAGSLYLRGLAKLKSGDAPGGNADVTAAQAIDPKTAAAYAAYGVTP